MKLQNLQSDNYYKATQYLSEIDTDWKYLIESIGPCLLQPKPAREPYEALIRAVAYQQLHTRAGNAIIKRLLEIYPEKTFPSPTQLLSMKTEVLRACGFSKRKIETIHGIANATINGIVPTRIVANGMTDEELIMRLTSLHGIGRWTVEMLLIYTLDRIDILPADDFGVRKGYKVLKSLDLAPHRKEMEMLSQPWSPYRTVATWYLWQLTKN